MISGVLFCPSAHAHGQLHARAGAGDPCSDNVDEHFKNHTGCNQFADASIGYIGGWQGDAWASAHASFHPNCAAHFTTFTHSECTTWGCNHGCAHANHAIHFSALENLEATLLDTNEPPFVPPPERANVAGNFAFVDFEVTQERSGLAFSFSPDLALRLQVDASNLSPGDEAFAQFNLLVDRALSTVSLHLRDGRITLHQDGVFETALLRVENHPSISNLFLVRLGPALNFQVPGVLETTDISSDMEVGKTGGSTNCIPLAITTQPQSVTNGACSSNCVTFSVTATGSGPVNAQWHFNGTPIGGATGPSLIICPVIPADAGAYWIIIRNGCSSVTSHVARLTVLTDTEPPRIICATDQTRCTRSSDGIPVYFIDPRLNDNLDPNPTVTCRPTSGSFFPIGETTVACEAIDACTNRSRCTFTVTVRQDTTAPEIICPSNIVTEAQFPGGAVVRWAMAAHDNCDESVSVQCDPPSGSEFPIGTTGVRCEAIDGSGNQAWCSFSVTVNEPSPLRIYYGASVRGSNLVTLHWGGDLVLQQTDSLLPPIFWRNVEVEPARDSNERTLVLSGTGAQGFFRLGVRRPFIPEIPAGYDDNDQDFSSELIKFTGLSNVISLLPTYHIRIHAIAVADDNGSKAATITPTSLTTTIDGLNELVSPGGIQFDFDPATDFETKNSTLLNRDFDVLVNAANYTDPNTAPPDSAIDKAPHQQARVSEARKHRGKLVIYFRWGGKWAFDQAQGHWTVAQSSGAFSSWSGEYVAMTSGGGNSRDLAHETGHYLQNRHPFVGGVKTVADAAKRIKDYVEVSGYPKSEGLDALDGDKVWVLDTAPDAAPTIFTNSGLDPCGPVDHLDIPVTFSDQSTKTYTLQPDRGILMSYFKGCTGIPHYFSPDQIARTRDGLENGLRHVLISRKADDLAVQIARQGDASDILASEISVVRTGFRQFVTALRDSVGDLQLIAWRATSDGQVVRQGEASAGGVSKVSACSLGLGLVSTAVRDNAGNIKVIIWKVTGGGQITRKEDASAGAISDIASCRLGIETLATAVRDSEGNLQVILWHITASGGITRKDDATAGAVSRIAICPAGPLRVATAVRTAAGTLKVILWEASAEGDDLVRLGSGVAGAISEVDSAQLDNDLLTTSVRDGSADLKVIAWQITDDGDVLRKDDAVGPLITQAVTCRLGVDMLATAVRSDIGNLRVLAWKIATNGAQITKLDESVPGAAGYISEVSACRVGLGSIVTAVRDDAGALKVILWEIAP